MRLIWLLLLSVTVVSADFQWWWPLFFGNDNTPSPTPAPTLEPTQCFATCDDRQSTQQQLDALTAEIRGTAVPVVNPLDATGFTCPNLCPNWYKTLSDGISEGTRIEKFVTDALTVSWNIDTHSSLPVCRAGLRTNLIACSRCQTVFSWRTMTKFGVVGSTPGSAPRIIFPKYNYGRNESNPICPGGTEPALVFPFLLCGSPVYQFWTECNTFVPYFDENDSNFGRDAGRRDRLATVAAYEAWRTSQLTINWAVTGSGAYCGTSTGGSPITEEECLSISLDQNAPFLAYTPMDKQSLFWMKDFVVQPTYIRPSPGIVCPTGQKITSHDCLVYQKDSAVKPWGGAIDDPDAMPGCFEVGASIQFNFGGALYQSGSNVIYEAVCHSPTTQRHPSHHPGCWQAPQPPNTPPEIPGPFYFNKADPDSVTAPETWTGARSVCRTT